jgi:hypothetical protein
VLSAFVEVDRGTMPNRRFKEKVERYFAYDLSGEYGKRYQAKHFRILVVVTSSERLSTWIRRQLS